MTIWFASGNVHKKKELAAIVSGNIVSDGGPLPGWELKIPAEAGIEFAPEETGNSFLENALLKAEALYRIIKDAHSVVIADDSGICVDALGGRPGIHSARYCGAGVNPTSGKKLLDAERNALLLVELVDKPKRSARFVCAMALYLGPDRFFVAQETLEGELVKSVESSRGEGGFGYDPILFIPELGRTVAELSEEEKNRISHRGKAGRAIAKILGGIIGT